MYANSRFKAEVDEWGQTTKWIEPGDKISQSDLGVSDEEWQGLIDSGAVVEKYPEGLDPQTPPAEYYRQNPDEAPAGVDISAAAAPSGEEPKSAEPVKQPVQPAQPSQPTSTSGASEKK